MSDHFQKWSDTETINFGNIDVVISFVYTEPANVVTHHVIIIVAGLSHCILPANDTAHTGSQLSVALSL